MLVTFSYAVVRGKCDSSDGEIECEVPEKLLPILREMEEGYMDMGDLDSYKSVSDFSDWETPVSEEEFVALKELCDTVYKQIIEFETEELRADIDFYDDDIKEAASDPAWHIGMLYYINVGTPCV